MAKRYSQPQAGFQIDWSNPSTRAIASVWVGSDTIKPYGSRAVSKFGVGGKGNGSSTFAILDGAPAASVAYGATGGAGDITFLVVTKIGALSSQQHFCNTANGSGAALGFRTNTTSVGLSQASGGSILNFTSAVTAGELCVLCVSGRNGSTDFFKNGLHVGNNATSYGSTILDGTAVIGRSGTSTQYGDHEIYLLVILNRRVSVAEGKSLTSNPWQIFQPTNRAIYAVAAAGGGVTISCTVGNAVADGTNANINQAVTISATPGAAVADGVTVRLNVGISAGVGNAVAAGIDARQNITIAAGVGNAVADGVSATIATGNTNTISCSVGDAVASGVNAALNLSIRTITGNAVAAGVDLNMSGGDSGEASYTNEVVLKPWYIRRNKKILLFGTAQEADAYIEAEEVAEQVIQEAQKTSRRARKRLRDKLITIEPIQTVDVDQLAEAIERFSIPVDLPKLIAQQDYERVMQILALAADMQDEEDIETLLLM